MKATHTSIYNVTLANDQAKFGESIKYMHGVQYHGNQSDRIYQI